MAQRPVILTSARVLVYVNGRRFGRCTSFTWSSQTQHREVETVDLEFPVELATARAKLSWQMGVVRTTGDGGAQGAGMVPQQTALSREKYFTLQLVDRASGYTLFKCSMCVTNSEQWTIRAPGVVAGQVSGAGITWSNESS